MIKKFLTKLFKIDEENEKLKKELLRFKTETPFEKIREMLITESRGGGSCEKYLGNLDRMEAWRNFYEKEKETIKFIKYMANIDGANIFNIFENVGAELNMVIVRLKQQTEEGKAELREERRKTLAQSR
jgi:hypothetical protein